MRWAVRASQTDEEWFAEYVATALDSPAPALPPAHQVFGNSEATWFETEPGIAFINTRGASIDDRVLAEIIVREQLKAHGIRQAAYWIDGDQDMRKTADWSDIEAKAKRYLQAQVVQMLRNDRNVAVGTVQGDHAPPGKPWQAEVYREDPSSRVITQWQCTCPWDQYAWNRTRQWKKYEGRPCAHVLAVHWASQNSPLDDEAHPQQQQLTGMPAPVPAQPAPAPFRAPMPAPQGEQMMLPGMMPGQATGTPPMPSGAPPGATAPPGVIPEFPMAEQPVVNPASVPGLKQPSPTNPVQYPGGTFSSVKESVWNLSDQGYTLEHVSAQPSGFENGNIVSTKNEDWGTYVGRSEEHGAGQPARIPKGSVGEVLGQDPTTGMVNVLFENKMTEGMGNLQPNGVVAWFFPSELVERPDVRRPGPAIRRRR